MRRFIALALLFGSVSLSAAGCLVRERPVARYDRYGHRGYEYREYHERPEYRPAPTRVYVR